MRSGSGRVVLVFEFMDASLLEVIRASPGTLGEHRIRNMMCVSCPFQDLSAPIPDLGIRS